MKIMPIKELIARETKIRKVLVEDFVGRNGRKPHMAEMMGINRLVREAVSCRSKADISALEKKSAEWAEFIRKYVKTR